MKNFKFWDLDLHLAANKDNFEFAEHDRALSRALLSFLEKHDLLKDPSKYNEDAGADGFAIWTDDLNEKGRKCILNQRFYDWLGANSSIDKEISTKVLERGMKIL